MFLKSQPAVTAAHSCISAAHLLCAVTSSCQFACDLSHARLPRLLIEPKVCCTFAQALRVLQLCMMTYHLHA